MSSCSGSWRARWAVILTLVWMTWLAGSSIAWEMASARPDLGPTWEPNKYLAYAGSLAYAFSHSLGVSSESTRAWPVWVEDAERLTRLLGDPGEAWSYLHIPRSGNGKYSPCLTVYEYGPLSFVVGALGLEVLGGDSSSTRAATNVLLLAFVSAMAWHGWQLAGFRGAILLGLASAASPWLFQWLRFFNYQSGALLMLALGMVAAHASRGLTRPAWCAWLGVCLGIGILFFQFVLFVAAPWLVALALPDLIRTRYSILAGGLILLLVQVFWTRYSWSLSAGESCSGWLDPLVAVLAISILLLLLGSAWLHARSQGWRPTTGLAVTVAVAGLLSAPYYLVSQHLHMQLIWVQMGGAGQSQTWSLAAIWEFIQILHGFHWLGCLWLSLGVLLLAGWDRFGWSGWRLAFSLLGGLASLAALVPSDLKYLVLLLPMALVLGFLWAARWKSTFLAVTLALLGMLWVQSFGWLYLVDRQLPWLPVKLMTPDSLSGERARGSRWWHYFPVAELPARDPLVWEQIPPGLRTSLVFHHKELPGEKMPRNWRLNSVEHLAISLSLRGELVEPGLLKEGDHVLIASLVPYLPPAEPRLGRYELSAPDHFYSSDPWFTYPMFLQLRRIQSLP